MVNFCTLFDSNYLSRGLLMYRSLGRHNPKECLYVIPFGVEKASLLKFEVIYDHLHNALVRRVRGAFLGSYDISNDVISALYDTYLADLNISHEMIFLIDPQLYSHDSIEYNHSWKDDLKWFKFTIENLWMRFNCLK